MVTLTRRLKLSSFLLNTFRFRNSIHEKAGVFYGREHRKSRVYLCDYRICFCISVHSENRAQPHHHNVYRTNKLRAVSSCKLKHTQESIGPRLTKIACALIEVTESCE